MRVLVLSANLGGNVPPTLAIAPELAGRGVTVEVAGILVDDHDRVADASTRIVELDASWAPRRDASGAQKPPGPTLGRIFFSLRLAAEAEALIRDRKPDVVVVDCMALALIEAATRTGIPVVVLLHTFAEYWRTRFLRGAMGAIFSTFGFSPRRLWDAAAAH